MKTIVAALFLMLSIPVFSQNINDEIEVYSFREFQELIGQDDDVLYVVNFWASWCKPCVHELPYFERVAQENANNSKVKFLFVSLDFESYLDSHVKPLVRRKNIQSEVILLSAGNPNVWVPKVNKKWAGSIPATLFVNNKKKINVFKEQSFSYAELKKLIDKLKNK